MPDIKSYIDGLHAAWVPRMLKARKDTWVMLISHIIQQCLGCSLDDLILTNVNDVTNCPDLNNLPDFILSIIFSFNKVKNAGNKQIIRDTQSIASSFVWGNVCITDKGKCLWYKNWIQAGFKYVKDFYQNDGCFVKPEKVLQKLVKKQNWMCVNIYCLRH